MIHTLESVYATDPTVSNRGDLYGIEALAHDPPWTLFDDLKA